jgi:hypothetical protein
VQDRDSVVAAAKKVDALDIERIIPLHGVSAYPLFLRTTLTYFLA